MKYIIGAVLFVAGIFGGYSYLSQSDGVGGGLGTIEQLGLWFFDGTNITQNTDGTPIKLTGYESAGDCLVTDSNGVVSTSACGGGGGSSKWELVNGSLQPLATYATNTVMAATFTATSTTATSTFAGAVGIGTTTPSSALSVTGNGLFTGTLTALNLSGTNTGDQTTITGNAGSATYASAVTLTADNTTNATNYPLFVNAATGNLSPRTDTGFTYNPSTGLLTSTAFSGSGASLTGTASGLTAGTVTTNANLTGMITSVGNAASLGSFTSANLSTALTNETGSGVAVFGTSPTFTTQITTPAVTNAGTLALSATGANVITASTNGAERLRVDSAGNVGVGTASPDAQFHIFGVGQNTSAITDAGLQGGILRLSGNSSSAGAGGGIIFSTSQGDTANSAGFAVIKGLLTNGSTNTTGDLAFSTRNIVADTALTERMIIKAGGNIGIGTSSPTSLLSVSGNAYFSGTVTGTTFSGSGASLTALNATQLTSGTVPDARLSGSYTGFTNLTGSGTVDFAKFLGSATDTAALPSYTWTGDTNTGIYQPGADQIGLSTAGVARLTIGATGIVNIANLTASRLVATDASKNLVNTITAANLAASVSDITAVTGTTNLVLSNSPTLVTPNLGTPTTLVGTNITGTAAGLTAGTVTTNANLTGMITSVGNAASLGSFTSANLATALTNETGSGVAVFGTSPAFTTSITTDSVSFTAFAGATTLLTIGGTGASASLFMPSTLDTTSPTTGAIRTSGGISAAKALNIGTTGTFGTSIVTPAITTASGALTVTPAAGSNFNLSLSTTGDFAVNTKQLYVDTSAGSVGIGTTTPSSALVVQGTASTTILQIVNSIGTRLMSILDNTITALGIWNFSLANLFLPNGSAPVVDAIGSIALDTTDNQLLVATSTDANSPAVIPTTQSIGSFLISSTSQPFTAGFTSGVSIPFKIQRDGYKVTEIYCDVDGGTSVVINFDNGSGNTSTLTCTTSGASLVGVGANSVVSAGSVAATIETGTVTGAVNYLRVSVFGVYTRE